MNLAFRLQHLNEESKDFRGAILLQHSQDLHGVTM
jgi:hypothetical protein